VDALTIISNAHALDATLLNLDLDSGSACIEAIFQKFFNNGSWSFNDFSSRNLIRESLTEEVNTGHTGTHHHTEKLNLGRNKGVIVALTIELAR
jgi:hypothetical protein